MEEFFKKTRDPRYVSLNQHTFDAMDRTFQFIAFEVFNHSAEKQDFSFLGIAHRHHKNDCLTIRAMVDGKMMEYEAMTSTLIGELSIGRFRGIRLGTACFKTSLLYDYFLNKELHIKLRRFSGSEYGKVLDLSNIKEYAHSKLEPSIVKVDMDVVMSYDLEFKQTFIQPGERLVIIFINGFDRDQLDIEWVVEKFSEDRFKDNILSSK